MLTIVPAADGLCVVDVFHKDGVTTDVGSGQQLLVAASKMITQCAQYGQHHEGGYLRDLGTTPCSVYLGSSRRV